MTTVTFTTQILLCIFNPIPIQLGHARTKGGLMMIFRLMKEASNNTTGQGRAQDIFLM